LAEFEELQKELKQGKMSLNQRKLKIFNIWLLVQDRLGSVWLGQGMLC
jgi:hypothetical protein